MALPVVCLHGWGSDSRVWPEGIKNNKQNQILVINLPGYGASPSAPEKSFDAALAQVAAAAPAHCHVLGWSLGAQFALAWAARYPAQVERLVLIAATPRFVAAPGWPQGMTAETFNAFAEALAREPGPTWRRFLRLQAQGDAAAKTVVRALDAALGAAPPAGTAVLCDSLSWLRDNDLRAACRTIAQPCLLLHGREDHITPPAAGEWLSVQLPAARLCMIDGASHVPFLSAPAVVGKEVAQFLQ